MPAARFSRLGSAVKDGRLRYVSVSQIESFDPSAYGGCNRRWWYRRVEKVPEMQGAPAALGEQVHKQLEHYLWNGDPSVLGEVARPGLRFLPKPGHDLMLELTFGGVPDDGDEVESPITIAGVPLVGAIDLAHARQEVVDDAGVVHQMQGVVEVLDHKTTARIDDEVDLLTGAVVRKGLAKSADVLSSTWQMRAYAVRATQLWPWAEQVALGHAYYQTRWPYKATKRFKLVAAADARGRLDAAAPLVNGMKLTAHAACAEDVEPNLAACDAWGGCPYRDRCSRPVGSVIDRLFGIRTTNVKKEESMGLLDKRRQLLAAETAKAAGSGDGHAAQVAARELAAITPPDAPAPRDVADQPDETAPPAGACALSETTIEVEAGARTHTCTCGATMAVKPKLLADGKYYALVTKHEAGVSSAAPKAPKPKKVTAPRAVEPADCSVSAEAVDLYVDADEDGVRMLRLEGYADELARQLASAEGAADIRCAPERSALAFGKWKGALAAAARENPPAPGAYRVASTSEVGMVVFDALATCGLGRVVRGS